MKHCILTLVLALAVPLATAQTVHELMQEAAYQERALGNLERANEIYTLIVDNHAMADRELAARSLYQLAVNEESLGRQTQAYESFRRLVSEYPEQHGLVAEAMTRGISGVPGEDVTKQVVWDMSDTEGLTDGEPSPDGKFVSFAAWESGNLGIKNLETGEITLLTKDGTWDEPSRFADNSSWSRDGSSIAFVWWEGNQAYLKVVDVATSAVRTLAEEYVLPWAWTSDGRVLGMWGDSEGRMRLVYVSSQDGDMEVVYEAPKGQAARADLSPNEEWIVINTMHSSDEARDMYVLPATGGEPVALAPHPADDRRVYWHPDGQSVVFESDRSGSDALWRVRVDRGQQVGQPELVYGDMRHALTRGFALDGRLFVERSQSESSGNLYTLGFDRRGVTALSAPVRMPLVGIDYNAGASFSSDGRYLSYISQRPNSVLVVRDLTTGREIEHDLSAIRLLKHRVDKPLWRPDSYELLVATFSGPRVIDAISGETIASIWTMDELTMHRPTWAADGSVIWGRMGNMLGYVPVPEGGSVELADSNAPEVTAWRILPEDEYCEGPAVHPSDGTVAYWCDYRTIYRLDPTTGESRVWWRVPDGETIIAHDINGTFAYTPDGGSSLLFQRWSPGEGEVRVWQLPVGSDEAVPVSGPIPAGWGLEIHPSGEQAVYTVLDGARNEMWVLKGLDRD